MITVANGPLAMYLEGSQYTSWNIVDLSAFYGYIGYILLIAAFRGVFFVRAYIILCCNIM